MTKEKAEQMILDSVAKIDVGDYLVGVSQIWLKNAVNDIMEKRGIDDIDGDEIQNWINEFGLDFQLEVFGVFDKFFNKAI